ncbi:MAG: DUF3502 domain-containing protein [Defluviitaleaceae bacterium]|nr:DUF3502 domain-containing protein [Defluviitaleaceae bacterium]
MKKFLLTVVCLALALAMFAACSRNGEEETAPDPTPEPEHQETVDPPPDEPDDEDDGPQFDEPPTTVSIWFMGGGVDNDDTLVVEAANARLAELGLNINIRPIWTGGWAMGEPAQMALDTMDTSVDIVWTGSWGLNYFNNARIGNYVRLDDPNNNLLERYGQDMMAAVPTALWDAFVTDGPLGFGVYGVPGYKDYAAWFKMDVNNTRLAELGFEFDEIFDMDGSNHEIIFEDVFVDILQASKDMWGDSFFPLNLEAGNFVQHFASTDGDLTGIHAFMFSFDPLNPANPVYPLVELQVENELFLRVLDRVRYFWERGFIDPRLAIAGEAGDIISQMHREGQYLFSTGQYAYGHTASMQAEREIDVRYVPLSARPIISTMSAAGSGFAVSIYSQNPAAAVQFLNAWYTDNELAVILNEGIEGIHWQWYTDDDGNQLVQLIPEGRETYATWRFGMGNIFALTPRNTDGYGYFARFNAYNALGVGTPILGFNFDNTAVAMEHAALIAVVDEFRDVLTIGAVDPAVAVPQYLAALMANGAEAVLEEINRQLEEFLAAR